MSLQNGLCQERKYTVKTIQAAVRSTVWKIHVQLYYKKLKNSPVILGLGKAQKRGVSEISHPAE
jgi:hypothetical protein